MTALDDKVRAIVGERQEVSSNISTQVRAVSLGTLGLIWLLLAGTEPTLSKKFEIYSVSLLWTAAVAISALLFDFVQSLFALIEINKAARQAESASSAEAVGYDSPLLRSLSNTAFVLKVVAAPGCALFLMGTIFSALTDPSVTG